MTTTAPREMPVVHLSGNPVELAALPAPARARLVPALAAFLPRQRWFGSKAWTLTRCALEDWLPLAPDLVLAIVHCEFGSESSERYVLPLGSLADAAGDPVGETGIAELVFEAGSPRRLIDALGTAACAWAWLNLIGGQAPIAGVAGQLMGHRAPANASDSGSAARLDRTIALARQSTPQVLSAEQSNSSIVYGRQGIFKLYRRIESGVQPDLEVVTYLTGRRFAHTPELIGAVEYVDAHSGRAAIGMLQCFASNQGTGWEQFLAHLGAQFGRAPTRKVASPQSAEWPAAAALGDLASLLGRRTAELHLALAGREPSATDLPETLSGGVGAVDPAFGAELIAPAWLRQLGQTVRQTVERSLGLLSGHIGMLELRWRATAEQVLRHSQRLLDRSEMHDDRPLSGWISRCHGDYHLGQVLWTGTDYMIIDFEGEPARVLAERRAKHSPLKDVAGMLRSFDYAGYCAAETVRGEQPGASLEGVRSELVDGLSRAFLDAYEQVMEPAGLLPEAGRQRQTLIELYLLEKACYELIYELNNRPDWAHIPLQAVARLAIA